MLHVCVCLHSCCSYLVSFVSNAQVVSHADRMHVLLHVVVVSSSRPLQYPDLQLLRESCPWDCVIINGVPEIPTAAGSSVRALSEAHGCGQHSPTTSQESSVGLPAEPCTLPPDVHQTEAGDVAAKSMLILGLRGQDHDLERRAPVPHVTCSCVACYFLLRHMSLYALSHVTSSVTCCMPLCDHACASCLYAMS